MLLMIQSILIKCYFQIHFAYILTEQHSFYSILILRNIFISSGNLEIWLGLRKVFFKLICLLYKPMELVGHDLDVQPCNN